MTRTKNYLFRALISAAVVVLMGITMILPAFADDIIFSDGTGPEDQATSALTKIFEMPVGLTVPEAKFEFEFEPISIDGDNYDGSNMPAILPITIEYDEDDLATSAINNVLVIENEATGVKEIVKQSEDLTIGRNIPWTKAGVYVYELTEKQSGIKIEGAVKERDEYSKAVYTLEIWVEAHEVIEDGEVVDTIYWVKYLSAKTHTTLVDVYYEGQEGGKKIDPKPGHWDTDEKVTMEGFSKIIFTNKYWKSDGGGTENPDKSALEITKVVDGNHPDNEDKDTVEFTFNVTVTQPGVYKDQQTYNAYILKADGTEEAPFDVKSGEEFSKKLMNGDSIVFVDLHVGSLVEVEEGANGNYKPKYQRTFAGTGEHKGTEGVKWGFPNDISPDEGYHRIPEENNNIATFTNTRTNATPTGLDVSDLPYIVLIGVAAAGLAAFVVMKSRKRAESDV